MCLLACPAAVRLAWRFEHWRAHCFSVDSLYPIDADRCFELGAIGYACQRDALRDRIDVFDSIRAALSLLVLPSCRLSFAVVGDEDVISFRDVAWLTFSSSLLYIVLLLAMSTFASDRHCCVDSFA